MRGGSRADPAAWRALPLVAHQVLEDVPLHDVWQVKLPGGGAERTLADVRSLLGVRALAEVNPLVRFLFRLRAWLGARFGWDDDAPAAPSEPSFLGRVPREVVERSFEPAGTRDGPFALLYALEREAASEARNATVHAFSVFALEPTAGGQRLFWAIYVAPVGPITRFYMALIDPFRRFLIYPAILRHVQRSWMARFGS